MQPLYDPEGVAFMWKELDAVGVKSLSTEDDVDKVLNEKSGTTLVVVNSVCGCAAGGARPAIGLALQNKVIPDRLVTVFAGVDRAATERARSFIKGVPPSSPSAALFKDGELVHVVARHDIEGVAFNEIVANLIEAFNTHCDRKGPSVDAETVKKTFGLPDKAMELVRS